MVRTSVGMSFIFSLSHVLPAHFILVYTHFKVVPQEGDGAAS